MAGCAAKHHARKVGHGEIGDTTPLGRVRPQGGGNVLQGGGAGSTIVWVGYVGPFGGNGEEGGRDAYWVPSTYHWETDAGVRRPDVGDARGGRSAGGIRNAVSDDLHMDTSGNHGTVGVATPII